MIYTCVCTSNIAICICTVSICILVGLREVGRTLERRIGAEKRSFFGCVISFVSHFANLARHIIYHLSLLHLFFHISSHLILSRLLSSSFFFPFLILYFLWCPILSNQIFASLFLSLLHLADLNSSHLLSSHLTFSYLTFSYLIACHLISHLALLHLILSPQGGAGWGRLFADAPHTPC